MPSYPTPAAVRGASGAPSLTKLAAMVRGGSIAPVLDAIWVPLLSAVLIVVAGAVGVWLKQPLLFAALGPTVLMVASSPGHETTRFRAVVGGHLVAICCAYLALMLLDASGAPTLRATTTVPLPRVWAGAGAVALMAIVQPQLRAYHPPAAATALLVTFGAYRMTGKTPLALVGGVLVVALAAELLQRLRPRGQ
ncbi:MAG TPA: HPP family protein [Gemmatimonadaceae bacterium]|nr:HPP family protein [Gemmatimonadaceae bacterium]